MSRCFLSLVLILSLIGIAQGQTSADLDLPEPCRADIFEKLPVLEKRKQRLELEVTQPNADLSKKRQELLRVIYEIECFNTRQRLEEAESGGSRASKRTKPIASPAPNIANIVEVTTFFATNRKATGSTDPSNSFGPEVGPGVQYGRAIVSIPITHKAGNIELPKLWKLERTQDPKRHFVLKSVALLDSSVALRELDGMLGKTASRSVLLFVHGYNTTFREAALRTAQLAHDLKFQGVPVFYSWPSAGQFLGYLQDAEAAQLSEGAFDQLLEELSKVSASEIYIVAHSMGNRVVTQALKARIDRGKEVTNIRELLLAAPDINVEIFRSIIAPRLAAMQGTRTTVYASSSDLALRASKAVHGFRRVGETAGGVFTFPGLETIDASGGSYLVRGYGHSYLMDSPPILKDIEALIRENVSAKQRKLREAGKAPNTFWKLP